MTRSYLTLALACSIFVAIPGATHAAQGDCGQPATTGASPTAADCLFILKAAIGSLVCDPECVCDTNNAAGITAADALLCLKKAVGQQVELICPTPCGPVTTSTSTTSSSTTSSTSTSTISTTTTSLPGFDASDGFDLNAGMTAVPVLWLSSEPETCSIEL